MRLARLAWARDPRRRRADKPLVIGGKEFIAEAGDAWIHPRGVPHFSEALEDCIQVEVKSPPRKTWVSQA